MNGYKLIVAGSRSIGDYGLFVWFLEDALRSWRADGDLAGLEVAEIVSGNAWRGVDPLAERYAKERGIPVKLFGAQWSRHGLAADAIRNREMADYADALFLLWDGESRGGENMLEAAEIAGLKVANATLRPL